MFVLPTDRDTVSCSARPRKTTLQDNPVFNAYVLCSGVLVLKTFSLTVLTGHHRFTRRKFANPEDTKLSTGSKVTFDDPVIERVRRAHRNDLENIPLFFAAGFLYVLTDPQPCVAVNLFRAYTAARVLHTLDYAVVGVPQPFRMLTFNVGLAATLYMAVRVVMHFK